MRDFARLQAQLQANQEAINAFFIKHHQQK
jgi:hypothetical protein